MPTPPKNKMLRSYYRRLGEVELPYQGRQMYMHSFDISEPKMADGYEDYLGPVKALLGAAGLSSGTAHMTVDEKIVAAGMSQRRPGPHVDGCFIPQAMIWGHGGGGWAHHCNNISHDGPISRMPVIVVSSFSACRAWVGEFDAEPKNDGDLSHLTLGAGELLSKNVGYLLSADCIHESMPVAQDTQRTFLRIALPVDFTA